MARSRASRRDALLVDPDHLADLSPDRVHRVERGHRLLEDHRDLVAANGAHVPFAELQQIVTAEEHCAPFDAARRRGSSRMIESEVTLLPQPDSPTMPTVPPSGTSNETPSTARSTRARCGRW